MKRLLYGLCLAALLCGCEGFLDETDPNAVTTKSYYQSTSDVEMSVRGCYNALYDDGYFGMMYLYTEVRSDNTTQENPGANNGVYYQFHNHTLRTDNTYLYRHYTGLYLCISRCNTVLAHIDDVTWADKERRAWLEADVRFLRALSYYYLVAQWGDVPCITRTFSTKDEVQAATRRDPKAEIYRVIADDLDYVLGSPLETANSASTVGRASKAAAYALYGKVLLTKAADTDFAADKRSIVTEAHEKLTAAWGTRTFGELREIDFASLWNLDSQKSCKEHIFQINYLSGNEKLGSEYAWRFQPEASTGLNSNKAGQGHNIFERNLVEEFEQGDARIASTYAYYSASDVYYCTKYADLVCGASGYGGNNWVVLRYADVLLMLAEAEYLLGNEDLTVKYINAVRARAGLRDYDPAYVPSDPEETVRNVWEQLIHERRCEFAGENQRWFDLVRMHTKKELIELMQAKNSNFGEKDLLLPIPNTEYLLNPSGMYQNPGY